MYPTMTKLPSHEAKHAELRIQFPRSTPPPPNSSTSAVRNRQKLKICSREDVNDENPQARLKDTG